MFPILGNYQEGVRNAKIYKTANGDYGVIVYDADTDYNEFDSFKDINSAEKFAKNWVLL